MPVTVGHVLSATTPDNTSYEIKPSNWNSKHAVTLAISGTDISGAFSNANGVSFGTSNGYITGSFSQSVQTQASGNLAATGFATTTTNGSVIVGTNNTAGQTLAVPPYLTTAMASNAYTTLAGTGTTFAGTNVSASVTLNSVGLNLKLSGGAGASTGNIYLAGTTTGQSSSSTFALSALNLSGAGIISLGYSSNSLIISAPASTTIAYAGTGFSGTNVSGTINSAGISLSGAPGGGVAIAASNSTFTSGTVVMSAAGGAITISNGAQSALFSVPGTSMLSAGANITISTTNNATITIIGGTASPSPVIISAGANSASLSSIVFSNSNGVSFGLNGSTLTASAAGGGVAIAASNSTFTSGTVVMSVAGGALTISNGAQSALFSVPQTSSIIGTNGLSVSTTGSTISLIPQTSLLAGAQGISISTTGSTISVMNVYPYLSYFEPQQRAPGVVFTSNSGSLNTASVYMQPFIAENYVSAYRMMMLDSLSTVVSTLSYKINVSTSGATTSTGGASGAHSYTAALFSRLSTGTDAHSASLISFASTTWSRYWSYLATSSYSTNASSGTASVSTAMTMGFISNIDSASYTTGSIGFSGSTTGTLTSTSSGSSSSTCSFTLNQGYMTGVRPLNLPLAVSLSPGEYWLGLQYASTSGTSGTAVQSGCMYTPMLGILSSTATIMYPLGLSANNTNTTNAQQGLGTLSGGSTASTTTAFPITAISNRSGIQTWFNMAAATL